jgi:hypothetical protein
MRGQDCVQGRLHLFRGGNRSDTPECNGTHTARQPAPCAHRRRTAPPRMAVADAGPPAEPGPCQLVRKLCRAQPSPLANEVGAQLARGRAPGS